MPKNGIDNQIRRAVDGFVSQISSLVRQSALNVVQEALGGGATPAARKTRRAPRKRATAVARRPAAPRRTAKRAGSKGRVRRSPEAIDQLAEAFQAYVRANPGQRIEAIAAGMGESSKDLKKPVQVLLGRKQLKTKGRKRGTMYFAGSGGGGAKSGGARKKRKKAGAKRKGAAGRKTGRKTARTTSGKRTKAA